MTFIKKLCLGIGSIIFTSVLLMSDVSVSYASDNSCTKTNETREFYLRSLYTQFMISAEKCGASREYSKFMTRYKKDILSNSDILKKYHKKQYGKNWKRYMDAFLTKVANEISIGTNGDDYYKFCYESWKKFHVMNNMTNLDEFDTYVYQYGGEYTKYFPKQCGGEKDFWEKEEEAEKQSSKQEKLVKK
jgi:hypothetical protein